MKRFFILVVALIFTLGLGSIAMAGDVKFGGEMYLNGYYSYNNDLAQNPDFGGWFKLKLTQDVSDLASWGVTLNFDYPGNTGNPNNNNSWKTDSSDTTKLDDAFIKLKFNPNSTMRIGRFESNYDQKFAVTSITNFGGEWDSQKEDVGANHIYALTNWKGTWRERNNFGFEASQKISDQLSLMETFFFPENEKIEHYGLKANFVPISNLTLTGAYYTNADNTKSFLAEASYKMDALSFYGLFNRQNLTSDHNNFYSYGIAYTTQAYSIYAERYNENGTTEKYETKLGYEFLPAKNTSLYVNLLYPSGYDMVIRTGIGLTF